MCGRVPPPDGPGGYSTPHQRAIALPSMATEAATVATPFSSPAPVSSPLPGTAHDAWHVAPDGGVRREVLKP
jgi:hypothetical protein